MTDALLRLCIGSSFLVCLKSSTLSLCPGRSVGSRPRFCAVGKFNSFNGGLHGNRIFVLVAVGCCMILLGAYMSLEDWKKKHAGDTGSERISWRRLTALGKLSSRSKTIPPANN